ncbi:hypothetical protein C8R46DRAFT_426526 [Mycena filopes]|nr:hypothetical protein C8R46DRAFT_426526 [Mycena filopes]
MPNSARKDPDDAENWALPPHRYPRRRPPHTHLCRPATTASTSTSRSSAPPMRTPRPCPCPPLHRPRRRVLVPLSTHTRSHWSAYPDRDHALRTSKSRIRVATTTTRQCSRRCTSGGTQPLRPRLPHTSGDGARCDGERRRRCAAAAAAAGHGGFTSNPAHRALLRPVSPTETTTRLFSSSVFTVRDVLRHSDARLDDAWVAPGDLHPVGPQLPVVRRISSPSPVSDARSVHMDAVRQQQGTAPRGRAVTGLPNLECRVVVLELTRWSALLRSSPSSHPAAPFVQPVLAPTCGSAISRAWDGVHHACALVPVQH